jgi:hypothetical protein
MMNQYKGFHDTASNFFSMVSFNQIDYGNIIAFATGVHASNLNPALVKRVDPSFSASLTACRSFYLDKNLPWALLLPEYFYNPKKRSCERIYHRSKLNDSFMIF